MFMFNLTISKPWFNTYSSSTINKVSGVSMTSWMSMIHGCNKRTPHLLNAMPNFKVSFYANLYETPNDQQWITSFRIFEKINIHLCSQFNKLKLISIVLSYLSTLHWQDKSILFYSNNLKIIFVNIFVNILSKLPSFSLAVQCAPKCCTSPVIISSNLVW